MNYDEILEGLAEVKKLNKSFLQKYEVEIMKFILQDNKTAEESLKEELLFEILTKIKRVTDEIDYFGKKTLLMGVLSKNEDGIILFNNEKLPMVQTLEVYLYDYVSASYAWTKCFVSCREPNYLVGIDRNIEIDGLKARIRC